MQSLAISNDCDLPAYAAYPDHSLSAPKPNHPIIDVVRRSMPETAQIIVVDMPTAQSRARIGMAVLFDRTDSSGVLERLGFHITGPIVGGHFLGCAVFDEAV